LPELKPLSHGICDDLETGATRYMRRDPQAYLWDVWEAADTLLKFVLGLRPVKEERESTSFAQRWRGKFRPAAGNDERYKALAKRYL
jgi:hypothetical protein